MGAYEDHLQILKRGCRSAGEASPGATLESEIAGERAAPQSVIQGRRASHGSVYGDAFPFWSSIRAYEREYQPEDPATEEQRFRASLEATRDQLVRLTEQDESGLAEVSTLIFGAHRLMLDDDSVSGEMLRRVQAGSNAREAIIEVVDKHAARFAAVPQARIAEKAQDIRDLGYRLVDNLVPKQSDSGLLAGRIVIARHVFPSDLARLAVEGASGAVLLGAAVTAHISILASSLGIPVLITEDPAVLDIALGTALILDPDQEVLLIDPDQSLIEAWQAHLGTAHAAQTVFHLRGSSKDGVRYLVKANVNLLKDALEARRQGAEGIGLYRSEFPFILRNDFLDEEEQTRIYRAIAHSNPGKPVVLRTADIGGDKLLQGRGTPEDNPFLGVRGVRFSLANPELFRTQIRAMLRAGLGVDLGIMLPMVSGVEEVIESRRLIDAMLAELADQGIPHNDAPRVGAMIELPSAALALSDLATETDFLSIGTNDLTMYLLAVDRTNEHLSHLYRSYHPSVLQMINQIVQDAHAAGTPVSVCGDAAADPFLTPFFCGIGVTELSVSPAHVESTKSRIADRTQAESTDYANEILSIHRVSDMERYVAATRPGSNEA